MTNRRSSSSRPGTRCPGTASCRCWCAIVDHVRCGSRAIFEMPWKHDRDMMKARSRTLLSPVEVWMSRFTLALVSLSLASGCATTGPRPVARASAPTQHDATSPEVNGVWDWMFRSTDDQGDMRVEQEEWHLSQRNGRIEGYYDRAVTMMSVDERLFRCNQRLGFTKS